MAKRRRNKAITIRMSEAEYDDLQNKVKESGLSQQAYIISAVHGSTIASAEEIDALKEFSRIFADQDRQMRGMATNVNQMARVANGQGLLPTANKLEEISNQIFDYRKEHDKAWLSIRSSISPLKITPA